MPTASFKDLAPEAPEGQVSTAGTASFRDVVGVEGGSAPSNTINSVKGNFPAMSPAESHWYDPVVNPIREGAVGRALHLDTITEAEKNRNPELRDRQLIRLSEGKLEDAPIGVPSVILGPLVPGIQALDIARSVPGTTGKVAKGLIREGAGFFGSMSTPENLGVMAAGGELPEIAKAATNPVVRKALLGSSAAVNAYFTFQMGKGASQSLTEASDAYKKGDYATMAVKLGRTGMEGLMAALGVHGMAKTAMIAEPRLGYESRQASKPLSQQDAGVSKGAAVAPEVLPAQTGVAATPEPKPSPVPPKPTQPASEPITWKKGEETHEEYRKRKAAANAGPAPVQVKPAEAPKPSAPAETAETPEQQLAKPRAESDGIKSGVSAIPEKIVNAAEAAKSANPGDLINHGVDAPKEVDVPPHTDAKTPVTDTITLIAGHDPIVKLETELGHKPSVAEVQRNLKMGYGAAVRAIKEAYPVDENTPASETKPSATETKPPDPEIKRAETPEEEIARLRKEVADRQAVKVVKSKSAVDQPKPVAPVPPTKAESPKETPKHTPIVAAQPPAKPAGNPPRPPIAGKYAEISRSRADVQRDFDSFKPRPGEDPLAASVRKLSLASDLLGATQTDLKIDKENAIREFRAGENAKESNYPKTIDVLPSRVGLPSPASNPKVIDIAPTAYNPSAVAGVEHTGIVNSIIGDMAKRGVDDLTFQPLDANSKPLGEPIQINDNSDPEKISHELAARGAKGIFYDHKELSKTWKILDAFKVRQEEAKPVRTGGEGLPAEGDDITFDFPVAKYAPGTEFMFGGKDLESDKYILFPPNSAKHIRVSMEDLTRRKGDSGFIGLRPGKSGERGSLSLGDIFGTSGGEPVPADPKANYSTRLAAKNAYNRNLSQTEKAAPPVFEEMIRAASASAQWSVLMHTAMPQINEALRRSGDPITPDMWREAMTQDSLIGKHDRWMRYADRAKSATDKELASDLKGYMFGALDRLDGKPGFNPGQDLKSSAAALLADKDFDTLRSFLDGAFRQAAGSVNEVMPMDEFERISESPGFQSALEVYKKQVVPFMEETHARNEGVMATGNGPSGVYYPLTPVESPAKGSSPGAKASFGVPKNPSNYFATGISEGGYDTSLDAFDKKGRRDTWLNNKAVAVQSALDAGLMAPHDPTKPKGEYLWPKNGVTYKSDTVSHSVPRIIVKGNSAINVPAGEYVGPKWFIKEIRPVFEKERFDENDLGKIIDAINWFSIKGVKEPIYHGMNITASIVCNTPFLGPSMADKAISQPFIKMLGSIFKIMAEDPSSSLARFSNGPESQEEFNQILMEAAKIGGVPEKFATTTFSKQYAADTGARLDRPHWPPMLAKDPIGNTKPAPLLFGKHHGTPGESKVGALTGFSLSPVLYGPHGYDTRARVLRYRLAKAMDPQASPSKLFNIMNQLGNYTTSMQSDIERWAKKTGLSWFYTAGSTGIRSGVTSNIPGATDQATEHMDAGDKAKIHAMQYWTGAATVLAGLWVAAYKAYRGQYPWDDGEPPVGLFQIPLKDEHRYSPEGRVMYGDGPGVGVVDFSFFNPGGAGRGMDAFGARSAYKTWRMGGTPQQVFESGATDIFNTYAHPFEGPALRTAFTLGTTLMGQPKAMYVTMGPGMLPLGPKNMTAGQKVILNLKQLNPTYGDFATQMGLGYQDTREKGAKWFQMMKGLGFDRLIPAPMNLEGQRKFLMDDQRQEEKPQP